MAHCLVALGSNLGNRRNYLRHALAALDRLPQTRLVARSRWLETAPIGGPPGQQAFYNGAAWLDTQLAPDQFHRSAQAIEAAADRQRRERWAARTLDVDLLLYDQVVYQSADLQIPHPRMSFRPFVLQGAADVAPWMIHPTSKWTVGRLYRHVASGPNIVAIATTRQAAGRTLLQRLASHFGSGDRPGSGPDAPRTPTLVVCRPDDAEQLSRVRLTLWLEAPPVAPARAVACGPGLVLADADEQLAFCEAAAALESVWPSLLTGRVTPYD